MKTLAERAWYAYNCLPKERGQLPRVRPLEQKYELSNRTLYKIFSGQTAKPNSDVVIKLGEALQVSLDWLLAGKGMPPVLRGPLVDRLEWLGKDEEWPAPESIEVRGEGQIVYGESTKKQNRFGVIVNPEPPIQTPLQSVKLPEEKEAESGTVQKPGAKRVKKAIASKKR